jgi:hypothetical protein
MGAVVAMLHAGVRCAFPAQQVLFAEPGPARERGALLWEDVRLDGAARPGDPRSVHVSTGRGARRIGCARPRLLELDRGHVWPLPELLAELLEMPHIVGIAEIEGALHWVVDARRIPADGA